MWIGLEAIADVMMMREKRKGVGWQRRLTGWKRFGLRVKDELRQRIGKERV